MRMCTKIDALALWALTGIGVASWLPAQDEVCIGPPEILGSVDFDGGTWNLGGFSLTADGLSVYYDAWTNDGGWIMVAKRAAIGELFEGGRRLSAVVNRDARCFNPRVSPDGRHLYYSMPSSAGGPGGWNIWVAVKDDPASEDFDRAFPLQARFGDQGVNGDNGQTPGCVSPSGRELFFIDGRFTSSQNIFVAHFVTPGEPELGFTGVRQVGALSWAGQDMSPTLSADERYLFWTERPQVWPNGQPPRPGGHGGTDVWMAVRPSIDEDFGPPVNLPSAVNSGGNELCPFVWIDESDRCFLVYSREGPQIQSARIDFGVTFGGDVRAAFAVPDEVFAGVETDFDASGSAPSEEIEDYLWTIGEVSASPVERERLAGSVVAHSFTSRGRYQVTLRVTTDDGICDYVSTYVQVQDAPVESLFVRGDSNGDGNLDLSDAVFILAWLFLGGEPPACPPAANTDGSAAIELTDAVYLLSHLFLGGEEPPAPFPSCGPVPPGELGGEPACVQQGACGSD